jgi:signal transduction histidine kinase
MDKSKEEFSSMITHELKMPLVPIIGYGNLLLGGRLGDLTKTQKEKVSIMYENAQRLSKLIQDVLDARKIELGRLRIDPQEISADELIERSINALTVAAEAKAVKLESKLKVQNGGSQNDILKVKCDPDRIHQVLCNLISNAIKFVPPDEGIIEVSAVPLIQDSSVVVFSVKDNGIGIPPEKQKGLFTKFYQVDTSLTRNVGGTGLGLTIAKGIVEAHGGKLWVESEQAKGSIFHFSIPMEDKK